MYKVQNLGKIRLNSMALVREQTIPTEREKDRPLSAKLVPTFLHIEDAAWSARRIPTAVFSIF
jgi:hypothetical protein